MEHENQVPEEIVIESKTSKNYILPASIICSSVLLAGVWLYTARQKNNTQPNNVVAGAQTSASEAQLEEQVLPSEGVILPVVWGNMGAQLVRDGVIDGEKFQSIYKQKGGLSDENKSLLLGADNGKLKMTKENSGYILNLLWAFGLANKNEILEKGEMTNPAYGGAKNFASTGGWTVSKGNPMDHYSRHAFVSLTSEQQALVDRVSKGIYRPCCGNSTHFPDCNHGMAMLGLLELMASQGVGEQEMYKVALEVNSYWFPNNYLTIATYMKTQGVEWKDVDPKEMLSTNYSSSQGNARIASLITSPKGQQGAGCGV